MLTRKSIKSQPNSKFGHIVQFSLDLYTIESQGCMDSGELQDQWPSGLMFSYRIISEDVLITFGSFELVNDACTY